MRSNYVNSFRTVLHYMGSMLHDWMPDLNLNHELGSAAIPSRVCVITIKQNEIKENVVLQIASIDSCIVLLSVSVCCCL